MDMLRHRKTEPAARHVLLLGALLLAPCVSVNASDEAPPRTSPAASLEERLKAGLRTRLPEEDEFVETVAMLVRTGRLPAKLVDSTYVWAIGRRKAYPFPAFEKALRLQAGKIGVRL